MIKKIILLAAILVLLVATVGCIRVPPGHVGIKIDLLGSDRGEMQIHSTGRYGVGMNTEWHMFPTFNQNYVWTQDKAESSPTDESFNFAIKGGLIVGLDLGIEYYLEESKITDIFSSYRYGVEELTDVVMRKAVRNALQTYGETFDIDALAEGGLSSLIKKVDTHVREEFVEKGIIIRQVSLIGAPRYPDEVTRAISAKIEATQKAIQRENEVREEQAQSMKKIAKANGDAAALVARSTAEATATVKLAEAEARANELKQKSYTPAVLQAMWLDKWDGRLPSTLTADNAQMLLNIGK